MRPGDLGLDALAQLVEYSRDGIAVLDEQLRVLYVNPAGCEILGYPLEQLIGRSGLLMIPAERHEEVPAVLQKIVELAAEVADARYGALGVLGPHGLLEDFITTGVTESERGAIGNLPVGEGILGALITDADPPFDAGSPAKAPDEVVKFVRAGLNGSATVAAGTAL
ncbi:MAG: PAS domain-containing protein [Actinomycetota bacterium]|nr:PAS domain-containing protein [Actinomycetota bacterium]